MAGSLREALEEAQDKHTEEATTNAASDAVETPTETVTEPLDESPSPETAIETPDAEAAETAPEKVAETEADKPAADAPTPYDNAPASWKGDAKEVWADLPEKARREVIRRERQIERTLHDTAQARQVAEEFMGTANQYEGRLREWGSTPTSAFKQFMDADRNLSSGPMSSRAAALAGIIKEYGIDIGALDSALAGAAPDPLLDVDARVQQLVQQQLAPFQAQISQQEQARSHQVVTVIDQMASSPEYPYFEDVREEMADLIEINMRRGVVVTLPEAYKKVVGYTGRTSPQQNTDTVRKARAASASVSGSPAAVTQAGNPGDLRGTILAALEK